MKFLIILRKISLVVAFVRRHFKTKWDLNIITNQNMMNPIKINVKISLRILQVNFILILTIKVNLFVCSTFGKGFTRNHDFKYNQSVHSEESVISLLKEDSDYECKEC